MQPIIDPQTAAVAAISDIIIRHSDSASICDHHNTLCVKKYPLKLLAVFSLRLSIFREICQFVSSLHPHIFTNFVRFKLIFSRMALINRYVGRPN